MLIVSVGSDNCVAAVAGSVVRTAAPKQRHGELHPVEMLLSLRRRSVAGTVAAMRQDSSVDVGFGDFGFRIPGFGIHGFRAYRARVPNFRVRFEVTKNPEPVNPVSTSPNYTPGKFHKLYKPYAPSKMKLKLQN